MKSQSPNTDCAFRVGRVDCSSQGGLDKAYLLALGAPIGSLIWESLADYFYRRIIDKVL